MYACKKHADTLYCGLCKMGLYVGLIVYAYIRMHHIRLYPQFLLNVINLLFLFFLLYTQREEILSKFYQFSVRVHTYSRILPTIIMNVAMAFTGVCMYASDYNSVFSRS